MFCVEIFDCEGGVWFGVVGMCLMGSFVILLMVEDVVYGVVVS